LRSIYEIQWRDNQKARIIDKSQKNEYRKDDSDKIRRSQMDTYKFLKNQQ
jgi:polyphosphate kinase